MTSSHTDLPRRRAAFVATRIAGTDGVSLEIGKWADVLERMGVECLYIAGESDRPPDKTAIIPEAHFAHPEILRISGLAFDTERRDSALTDAIMEMARVIRNRLNRAIDALEADLLIAQNSLTIPMNIPLGIALVQVIQERGIPCVAHHHDFYWERERFLLNAVDDLLRYAFPPALPSIQHVTINSVAADEFSRRTGLSCRVIPNVMDFANPPEAPDDYALAFRSAIGIRERDSLILQPTRIVSRKGIEHSIELVRRLELDNAKLVITHAAGDEGQSYANFLRLFSDLMDVDVIFADEWVADHRGTRADGQPLFTLDDVYSQADLVTYPSKYEGFGNAFLEAIYYRQPILCQRYLVYRTDIEPCGFRSILFEDLLTREAVDEVHQVLRDPQYRQEMVEHNYEVARELFSYELLADEFRLMLSSSSRRYAKS